MSKILGQYDAAEFKVIESFLTRTTQLLIEQAAVLREQARATSGQGRR
ncbi:MAG TPA: hypothetical protein VGL81_06700 [Polyangiaceae bacterium]|jgi:hypothetical protein